MGKNGENPTKFRGKAMMCGPCVFRLVIPSQSVLLVPVDPWAYSPRTTRPASRAWSSPYESSRISTLCLFLLYPEPPTNPPPSPFKDSTIPRVSVSLVYFILRSLYHTICGNNRILPARSFTAFLHFLHLFLDIRIHPSPSLPHHERLSHNWVVLTPWMSSACLYIAVPPSHCQYNYNI